MKTLPASQMDELWDKYWNEMSSEWFKLEVLQDYVGEDDGPSLRAWLQGDKQRSIDLFKTDEDPGFTADCGQKTAQGVSLIRIHVIKEPKTPYMEWELEYYKHISIPLRGEKVFVVDQLDTAGLTLPKGDLMIFDECRAIENSYDQNGRVVSANFYDESDDLSQFLLLKNELKKIAKPF